MARYMLANFNALLWLIRVNNSICKKEGRKMKKFSIFFVLSVIAILLSHLVAKWVGVKDSSLVVNLLPVALLFLLFYVCGCNKGSSGK